MRAYIKRWIALLALFFAPALFCAEEAPKIPAPPKGALKYTVMVQSFENRAGWSGDWALGEGMTTVMTDMLKQSGWFTVLGDASMRKAAMAEQDFAAGGRVIRGKKTPKMGRMTPAQLLLKGVVTNVQETGSGGGGINFMGVSIGGSGGQAQMNFTIYLVNSETGQVVASKSIVGKSGRKGFRLGYYGSDLGGLTGRFGGQVKDNVMEAAENALGQALAFIVRQLDTIPWEGTIILKKGNLLIANRGAREGVTVGRIFAVGSMEQLIDPDTGEVLDMDMNRVGTAKVVKVKQKVSYLKPLENGGAMQKGMSIFPLE